MILVELADFERTAGVEVWEGDALLATLPRSPFRFPTKNLSPGTHALKLVATDGARTATPSVDVVIP